MNAGLATLKILQQPGTYEALADKTARLAQGLQQLAAEAGIPVWVNVIGAMFSLFFTGTAVKDFASACTSDVKRFARYHRGMLEGGFYLAPSQFESVLLSTAHAESDIDRALDQAEKVFKTLG
jgi:glutamate-1-semialdehyde 2,1-aminomutase